MVGRLKGDVPVSRQLLIHVLALSVGVSTVDQRDDARGTDVEQPGQSEQQSGQTGQSGQSERHEQHEERQGQGQGQGQQGMKERTTEKTTERTTEVPSMLRQAARRCWFALRHRVACWAVARPRDVDVIMRWSARQVRS